MRDYIGYFLNKLGYVKDSLHKLCSSKKNKDHSVEALSNNGKSRDFQAEIRHMSLASVDKLRKQLLEHKDENERIEKSIYSFKISRNKVSNELKVLNRELLENVRSLENFIRVNKKLADEILASDTLELGAFNSDNLHSRLDEYISKQEESDLLRRAIDSNIRKQKDLEIICRRNKITECDELFNHSIYKADESLYQYDFNLNLPDDLASLTKVAKLLRKEQKLLREGLNKAKAGITDSQLKAFHRELLKQYEDLEAKAESLYSAMLSKKRAKQSSFSEYQDLKRANLNLSYLGILEEILEDKMDSPDLRGIRNKLEQNLAKQLIVNLKSSPINCPLVLDFLKENIKYIGGLHRFISRRVKVQDDPSSVENHMALTKFQWLKNLFSNEYLPEFNNEGSFLSSIADFHHINKVRKSDRDFVLGSFNEQRVYIALLLMKHLGFIEDFIWSKGIKLFDHNKIDFWIKVKDKAAYFPIDVKSGHSERRKHEDVSKIPAVVATSKEITRLVDFIFKAISNEIRKPTGLLMLQKEFDHLDNKSKYTKLRETYMKC